MRLEILTRGFLDFKGFIDFLSVALSAPRATECRQSSEHPKRSVFFAGIQRIVIKVTDGSSCHGIVVVGLDGRVGLLTIWNFLMRAVGAFLLAVWSVCSFGQPALADRRVALVIGNSGYHNVARLGNPANDALAMTKILNDAGFDLVETRRDLKISEMRRVLRDFARSSRDADVAVVYYAGHGIEVDGTNYLIPVDAMLEQDFDVYDEAFSLERVLAVIEPAKQLRLVILDACRDNPFANTMKRTVGSRSIARGLAKVEPTSPNTLIAFASKAGSTASDGDSKNSPFTAALVKHIAKPGLDLRKAFGFVRDDVLESTNNKQEPYVYGSLGGDDVPLVPAKPIASSPTTSPNAEVRRDYELALQIGTRDVWTAFLAQYPDGLYATLAKGQLNKVASEEARVAATEKARLAEEEKARLRAEGAKHAEQVKAAAQAKAAEGARIAAEKTKLIEQAKAAAAEQARAAAEKAAAEKLAVQKVAAENLAAEEAKAATAKAVAAKVEAQKTGPEASVQDPKPAQQVASLPPNKPMAEKSEQPSADVTRSIQIELRRVGCYTGALDGAWSASSRRSLELFNKSAGAKLDVKLASLDALEVLKAKPARVCPLICNHGYKSDGDSCTKITCKAGFQVGEDNTCERVKGRKHKKPEISSAPTTEREAPLSPRGMATSSRPAGKLQGEPPDGTIPYGARVVVQSSACQRGQVLEIIGGSNSRNIRRQRRCIAAN